MPSQEENQGKHHYLQQKSRVFTSWVLRSTNWSNGGLMLHFAYICHETKLPVWPVSPQTHWKHLESRLGWPLTSHRVINLSVLAILRSFTNLISLWSDIHHKLPKAHLSCINSRMFNWYHNFFYWCRDNCTLFISPSIMCHIVLLQKNCYIWLIHIS